MTTLGSLKKAAQTDQYTERRLRALAIFEAIPDDEFDIENWDCGHIACFGGHLCRDPWMQAQGLVMKDYGFSGDLRKAAPHFKHCSAYDALSKFFDLNRGKIEFIFNPIAYEMPEDCRNDFSQSDIKAEGIRRFKQLILAIE